jgi:hypothetical protein
MLENFAYIPDRQVVTNAKFIVVSNNPQVLRLEQGSRCFALFETSDKLQGKVDFREICDLLVRYGQSKAILVYFLDHEIPAGWYPEQSYPRMSVKKQIECANLSMIAIYSYSLALTFTREKKGST